MMRQFSAVFRRDFAAFFKTYAAYVMLAVYLVLSMVATFYFGGYFQLNNAGLISFFRFQPEILALLVPALTMRSWADERRSGTIEFLLTQPVGYLLVVLAKFAAAWIFVLLMLILTTPLWLSTAVLAAVDNLNILSGYLGCLLAGGAFCALGCMVSSFNKNPVITYIMSVFVCWGLSSLDLSSVFGGTAAFSDELLVKITQALNFSKHLQDFFSGHPGTDSLIYFAVVIVLSLWLNLAAVEHKKG